MKAIKYLCGICCILTTLLVMASKNPGANMRPEPQPDPNKKPCTDFVTKENLSFNTISLRYDWSFIKSRMPDWIEMQTYHSELNESGKITWLSSLINPMTDNLPSDRRPYIKSTITNSGDCTGSKITYEVKESSKLAGNTLYGVSYLNRYFVSAKIEIGTMKGNSGSRVLWEATVNSQQMAQISTNVKKYEGAIGYSLIKIHDDFLYYRKIGDTTLRPIDNTFPERYTPIDIIDEDQRFVEREIDHPTLSKPVYKGGAVSNDATWNNKVMQNIDFEPIR